MLDTGFIFSRLCISWSTHLTLLLTLLVVLKKVILYENMVEVINTKYIIGYGTIQFQWMISLQNTLLVLVQ